MYKVDKFLGDFYQTGWLHFYDIAWKKQQFQQVSILKIKVKEEGHITITSLQYTYFKLKNKNEKVHLFVIKNYCLSADLAYAKLVNVKEP